MTKYLIFVDTMYSSCTPCKHNRSRPAYIHLGTVERSIINSGGAQHYRDFCCAPCLSAGFFLAFEWKCIFL